MTRDELQANIHSIEDRIQRKEHEISRDDAAIIKYDSNIMSAEQSSARTNSASTLKTYQRRIESNKKDKLRHQELRNRHQQELNRLKRDLLSAQRQLYELPSEKNDAPISAQLTTHIEKIYQIFVSSTYEDLKMERQEVMAAVVMQGGIIRNSSWKLLEISAINGRRSDFEISEGSAQKRGVPFLYSERA